MTLLSAGPPARPSSHLWACGLVTVAAGTFAAGPVVTLAQAAAVAPGAAACTHPIEVRNGTGEPVVVRGLGPDLPLAAGALGERCARQEAAVYTVTGRGWRYDERLDLAHWTLRRVELAPPVHAAPRADARAWVDVRNATGERAELDLGSGRPVAIEAGGRVRVEVPSGPRTLVARLADGRVLRTGVDVEPGHTVGWAVRARATTLTLASRWDERVLLRIDGWPRGAIEPNGELRLDVAPGRHDIQALASVSKLRFGGVAVVKDGDALRVSFEPPGGTVHVAAKAHPVQVLVAGRLVADLPAGARAELAVDAGRTVVEVRDVEAGRATVWRGAVQPMRQVEVAAPAREPQQVPPDGR